jgi:hypothetical protein
MAETYTQRLIGNYEFRIQNDEFEEFGYAAGVLGKFCQNQGLQDWQEKQDFSIRLIPPLASRLGEMPISRPADAGREQSSQKRMPTMRENK